MTHSLSHHGFQFHSMKQNERIANHPDDLFVRDVKNGWFQTHSSVCVCVCL